MFCQNIHLILVCEHTQLFAHLSVFFFGCTLKQSSRANEALVGLFQKHSLFGCKSNVISLVINLFDLCKKKRVHAHIVSVCSQIGYDFHIYLLQLVGSHTFVNVEKYSRNAIEQASCTFKSHYGVLKIGTSAIDNYRIHFLFCLLDCIKHCRFVVFCLDTVERWSLKWSIPFFYKRIFCLNLGSLLRRHLSH